MMATTSQQYYAIVTAAGSGKRFGSEIPKQYCKVNGKSVLAHTLDKLLNYEYLSKVIVVIAPNDLYWGETSYSLHPKVLSVLGGKERYHSVMQGLAALQGIAAEDDWILIHDAARPMIRHADLDKLISALQHHPIGGLLATPVKDTIKQVELTRHVAQTLDRTQLWHALTPQMFRYQSLILALKAAIASGYEVTDEASAIEQFGGQPLIVEGSADNIKITHPSDLGLAEYLLNQQSNNFKF